MAQLDELDLVIVGRIVKAHGIRGEVKVLPETDDPERFLDFESVYVGTEPGKVHEYTIKGIRFQPSSKGITVLASFDEVKTRNDADALVKSKLYVSESELELDSDEYFLYDLIGCTVLNREEEVIGVVKDVLEMPAQIVYLVSRTGKSDVMIPAVDVFIEEVDLDKRRIVINSIDGLIDD